MEKATGVTRIVLDVTWEGITHPYGTNGTEDCGTVAAIMDLLDEAIQTGKLTVDNHSQTTATEAAWASYVTNVKHHLSSPIHDGKALHPILRETKGQVGEPASKKEVVEPTWITTN